MTGHARRARHRRGHHRAGKRRALVIGAPVAVLTAVTVVVGVTTPSSADDMRPRGSVAPVAYGATARPSALELALARFRWADASSSPFHAGGATVILVRGTDPLTALGLDIPQPAERGTLSEAQAWARRSSTQSLTCVAVSASLLGGETLLVATGGSPTTTAALPWLSVRGAAVSISEDEQLDATLAVAERGRIVRQLDPVLGTATAGEPLKAEDGISFGVPTSLSAMSRSLLVAARLTGVSLSRADLIAAPGSPAVGYCS